MLVLIWGTNESWAIIICIGVNKNSQWKLNYHVYYWSYEQSLVIWTVNESSAIIMLFIICKINSYHYIYWWYQYYKYPMKSWQLLGTVVYHSSEKLDRQMRFGVNYFWLWLLYYWISLYVYRPSQPRKTVNSNFVHIRSYKNELSSSLTFHSSYWGRNQKVFLGGIDNCIGCLEWKLLIDMWTL